MTARRDAPGPPTLVEAVAGERERIATQLHDEVVQTLSAAGLRLELLRVVLGASAPSEVAELHEVIAEATRELRAVMESLRRPPVGSAGLAYALRQQIAPLDSGGRVSVIDDLVREPPEDLAIGLHWLAEDCVRALRRARGYGAITLTLRSPAGTYEVEVHASQSASAEGNGVVVLDGPRRLAALIGAELIVDEPTPGVTRIVARVAAPDA